MKKLFSSKSGFSLIEIIIAFAIFAIMAAMVSSIMSLALYQRSANMEFADDVEAQKDQYAKIEKDLKYGTKSGTMTLNFGAKSYSLDYSDKTVVEVEGASTGKEGINYFVGNADYKKKAGSTPGSKDTPKDSNSLIDQIDSYIYGSPDFDWIRVDDFRPADASEISKAEDAIGYSIPAGKTVYILHITPKDNEKVTILRDLLMWRSFYVRMPNDINIYDYGYIYGDASATFTKDTNPSKVGDVSGYNYEISKSSKTTIHISIPKSKMDAYYNGKLVGEDKRNLYHFSLGNSGSNKYFLVLDTTDTTLNEKSFGDNWTTKDEDNNEDGRIHYKAYVEKKEEDGVEKEIVHVNVYAGKPKTAEPETPDDETTES